MKMRRDEAIETNYHGTQKRRLNCPMKMRRDEAIETNRSPRRQPHYQRPMKMRRDEAIETYGRGGRGRVGHVPYEDAP